MVCQQADEATEIALDALIEQLAEQSSSNDFSMCFIICVSLSNDAFSISGNLAFVNVGLSYDMDKGFGVGVGVTAFGIVTAAVEVQQNGSASLKYGAQVPAPLVTAKAERAITLF
jgi:hypothetical protein